MNITAQKYIYIVGEAYKNRVFREIYNLVTDAEILHNSRVAELIARFMEKLAIVLYTAFYKIRNSRW